MLGTFHALLHFILASSPVGEVLTVHSSSRPWYTLSCKDVWAWWIKKWSSLVSSVSSPAYLLQHESPRELLPPDWLVLTSSSSTFSFKSQLWRSHSPSPIKIHEQIKDTFSVKPPPQETEEKKISAHILCLNKVPTGESTQANVYEDSSAHHQPLYVGFQ